MKRMVAAAILAIFIHAAVFFLIKCFESNQRIITAPLPKIVTVTMSYRSPALTREKKTAVKKKVISKKPAPPSEDIVRSEPQEIEQPAPEKKPPPADGNRLKEDASQEDSIPQDAVEDDIKSSTHGNSMSNITAQVEAVPLYNINPPPKYPRIAVKRGYQGTAELMVLVNKTGSVDDVWLFESSGYSILDETALQSVKDWSFTPGKEGDQAIDMWVRVPVRFQLQ